MITGAARAGVYPSAAGQARRVDALPLDGAIALVGGLASGKSALARHLEMPRHLVRAAVSSGLVIAQVSSGLQREELCVEALLLHEH